MKLRTPKLISCFRCLSKNYIIGSGVFQTFSWSPDGRKLGGWIRVRVECETNYPSGSELLLRDLLSIAVTLSESFTAHIRVMSNLNILEKLRQLAEQERLWSIHQR